MVKPNKRKCVKREENIKNKNIIKNNARGEPKNDPREGVEEEPTKENENVVQEELENREEHENVFIPERENDPREESSEINDSSTEPNNDPGNEPENDLRIEVECISSLNSIPLEDIRDILYELHEYFDEFQIEIVACPDLTGEPYKFAKTGMSGDTTILEVYTPNYTETVMLRDSDEIIEITTGWNYFLSKRKPGIVLKIRAKGRKTNYNIITLIQNILHKRFSYKMGLGELLLIHGGLIKVSQFIKTGLLWWNNEDLNATTNVYTGVIVNDPVIIEGQQDGLFYTNNRYMFRSGSDTEFIFDRFLNDITPEETECICYFDIAEHMFYYY